MRKGNGAAVAFVALIALTTGMKVVAPSSESVIGQTRAWAHAWISLTQGS